MTPISETRLAEFETAALPHIQDLFRTAARVLGNRSDAEDLVQEAYLQAWKSFHRFTTGTNCRAWLFRILFHVIHHHRRKWFSFKLVREGEELLENFEAGPTTHSEEITDGEVLAALEKVPEQFREVLLLSDVQEFTYKEISDILQIPLGTVMSRLSRGRRLLRGGLIPFAQLRRIGIPQPIPTAISPGLQ